MNKRVINIVNFVRGVEPREPEKDLFLPVVEELRVNRRFGLKSTVLLQYDAILRDDVAGFFSEAAPDVELGLWFEMNRPLTEAVGIEWRGRPGYDWDWFVNPGFLPAYTLEQRRALIDEAFRLFREKFGFCPKVAGSWLLDAYSMQYMSEKYGLDAMCICREQYAVDAYTLWGGYYTGGYYPSRNNALCPAADRDNAVSTPVFRMLGIDPIYGYDEAKYPTGVWGCNTMEPVWTSGSDRRIMEWYMDVYYKSPCLSYSHATTGQENSFGWPSIKAGYELQAELISEMAGKGEIDVETLGETGRAFKEAYDTTPCNALCALSDRTDNGLRAVWFDSPFYRAGLVLEPGGRLYIRDLNIFDPEYKERYLDEPCTAWDARYDNLPVVDNRLWSSGGIDSMILIADNVNPESFTVSEKDDETLVLGFDVNIAGFTQKCSVSFEKRAIRFNGLDSIEYHPGIPEKGQHAEYDRDANKFVLDHFGFRYEVAINGAKAEMKTESSGDGQRIIAPFYRLSSGSEEFSVSGSLSKTASASSYSVFL
ncbi:MAG: hypothetical protein J5950_06415 [Clostridia bacterium]|nr:hypothetical protein [Clostridia bacterium]